MEGLEYLSAHKSCHTCIHDAHLFLAFSDQPSGWLFGEKPLKPGQKRVREDWEMIWYIGFWGTTFVGIMMQIYKPDRSLSSFHLSLSPPFFFAPFFFLFTFSPPTLCFFSSSRYRTSVTPLLASIQTWARQEAEQKMEKPTYEKS